MEDALSEALKTIGWETGFRLPIANEENQALERELARLVIKKSRMAKEFDDASSRYNNITDHLKYVRQQVQQNQTLLTNYRQQLDNEKHKLKLKQAEKDTMDAEIRKMDKETDDISERLSSKKVLLARNLSRLEKIKAEAEWDAQALKAWEESIKKRDDDNELLKKFSAEDQRRVLELEQRRKGLQAEISGRKQMLAKMDVDVTNYEHIMMRTGSMLNELKEERDSLVSQWQESVKNLRQKDKDIKRALVNIEKIQEIIGQHRENVEEQESFLSNEKNANKYIQIEISEINISQQRLRKQHAVIVEENYRLMIEHATKRKSVQRATIDMNKIRLDLKCAKKLSEHYRSRIKHIEKETEAMEDEMNRVLEENDNAQKNVDTIERMIKDCEKNKMRLARTMQSLTNKQYKINAASAELTSIGTLRKAEVCARENALSHIRKKSKAANALLIHKKQLLSDLEMKVACLEAQIGNTDPDDMQDFEEMWKTKIIELEETLAEHTEIKNLLHGQILKLQKENLRLVNAISNDSKSQQLHKDKLQSLLLQIEGGIKQSKAGTLRTQEKQVTENVLKLKVDKLIKATNQADKEIYNLQQYKLDLATTLKQRHIEVNTAKDVLFAKKKNLEEDRGRLRADIAQRNVRIQQLENKYQLSLGLLGKDEAGEPMTLSTAKIRAAQNRYELQQEGDELDKKIRKAEKEIVAMENTLKIVNMTNHSFKNSLTIVDEHSEQAQEMGKLEDNLTENQSLLKEKKQTLVTKATDHRELREELARYEATRDRAKDELHDLEDTLVKLQREECDRQEKIERASRQIKSCKKRIEPAQLEKYDRELYIRQLQDTNRQVLYQMADLGNTFAEVQPVLNQYMEAHKLEPPKSRTSCATVSSDSIRTPSSPSVASSGQSTDRKLKPSVLANITSLELKFDGLESPGTSGGRASGQSRKSQDSKAKK